MSVNQKKMPLPQCQDSPHEVEQQIDNTFQSDETVQQNVSKVENQNFNLSVKPLETDPWIYRVVVGGLTSALLICLIGTIGLQIRGKSAPDLLTGLATGSLSALTALLAPSPVKNK